MNQTRRKELNEIAEKITDLRESLRLLGERIVELKEEEQSAFDNLPEGLQAGERGQAMEQSASNLDDAENALDSVQDELDNAYQSIESATAES